VGRCEAHTGGTVSAESALRRPEQYLVLSLHLNRHCAVSCSDSFLNNYPVFLQVMDNKIEWTSPDKPD
jgi:hypothetical protein